MSSSKMLLWSLPLAAAVTVFNPGDASACGGCFVPPAESTQVTGHRMILSVGMGQSTLYDQIEYDGDPAEFAWVLPIKGTVDVGLSSDLVFNQLGNDTGVTVLAPPQNCPIYSCGNDDFANEGSSTGTGGGSLGGPDVEVLASEVVGPFETVQLASTDPNALNDWLAGHGYSVPSDIQPIVSAYVNGGFNFLAMKLVPGVGIDKMRPVRITTQGSSPVLPLKMVAAGTGATTTLTLWVIGEARYQPTNFPSFEMPTDQVLWDYATNESNYKTLRKSFYDASNGHAWLTEAAQPYSADFFRSQILNVVSFVGPEQSGYDDGSGDYQAAEQAATDDMNVLFAGMNPNGVYVTRLRAELSRDALGSDLFMEASSDGDVSNVIQTTKWTGTQPACPPPPDCNDPVLVGGPGFDDKGSDSGFNSGCAVGSDHDDYDLAGFLGGALGLFVALRRKRRRS